MEPGFGLVYLGVGYSLAFLALILYIIHLARRQRALEKRLNELKFPGSDRLRGE